MGWLSRVSHDTILENAVKRCVMSEVMYSGENPGQVTIREGKERRPLNPRFDLRQQSLAHFGWGKDEKGSIQLSLALLADALGSDERALALHHSFRSRVVATFPARWTITRSRIQTHARRLEYQAMNDLLA
jgi:hypothetical protein